MNKSDQSELDAVAQGDRAVFERVYRSYKHDLLTITIVMLGERSLAEDVLHDVFVSLVRRAGVLRLTGTLRNYLITSCLNRARDVLQKRSRETAATPVLEQLTSEQPKPGNTAEPDEELERLRIALQSLPAEQREVVTLHIHGRMKFHEIADMLAISSNTAQSRYRYALAKLRKNLTQSNTTELG